MNRLHHIKHQKNEMKNQNSKTNKIGGPKFHLKNKEIKSAFKTIKNI